MPLHIFRALEVDGEPDCAVLQEALNDLLSRHESLRVSFRKEKRVESVAAGQTHGPLEKILGSTRFRQMLQPVAEMPFRVEHVDADEPQAFERIAAAEIRRPFSLERAPLIRATLVMRRTGRPVLIVGAHHLVADRWSLDLIERELALLYRSRLTRAAIPLSRPTLRYADFAQRQRTRLDSGALDVSIAYWRSRWRDYGAAQVSLGDLGADGSRRGLTFAAARESMAVDTLRTSVLRTFAVQQRVTMYVIFLAAFVAALRQRTHRTRLAVWTHFANRVRPDEEDVVGWVANSHILGVDCPPDVRLDALLRQVRSVWLEAVQHQAVPAASLWWDVARTSATTRFLADAWISFDVIVDRRPSGPLAALARAELPPTVIVPGLQVSLVDRDVTVGLSALYSSEKFRRADVQHLLTSVIRAASLIVDEPGATLSALAS